MEKSAQRRERLKAMRMEASQEAATYNDGSEHSAVSLSNPLLESTADPEGQMPLVAQSFNYYTDPMAAFSGNKGRSKFSPQISQDYSSTPPRARTNEMFPSPSPQAHLNHSPNQRMLQPHGQYANANYAYTSNAPQGGNFPCPSFDFQGRNWNSNSPRPGGYRGPGSIGFPSPGPHFSNSSGHVSGQGGYHSPQPHFSSGPGHGSGQGGYHSPHISSSPGHGSGRGYPSPGPHFRNCPNYGSGQGGNPSSGPNQGRGHWFGNSMSSGSSSGRGRGRWSGQGGGRGQGRQGANNHASAEDRPDIFYNKSMVEDPWKFLEPVIWKSLKKPWLPNSLSTKKARVSESPRQQKQSSSQPSLAEILAASFNEAASEEPSAG